MNNKDLLKQVWDNCSFEDILNAGLELRKISSSDIIEASNIYEDPNKEYEEYEIKNMLNETGLSEILNYIQDEYSLEDIVDELGVDDVLDTIDADVRLDSIKYTMELEDHDSDVRDEYRDEVFADLDGLTEFGIDEKFKDMSNWSADELHKMLCNVIGTSYYDPSISNKIKERLNKNSFNIKY